MDMLIVRELTGDVYFGEPKGRGKEDGKVTAFDNMITVKTRWSVWRTWLLSWRGSDGQVCR